MCISTALLLAGCSSVGTSASLKTTLPQSDNQQASLESMNYCHGGGCRIKTRLSITTAEWHLITAPFGHIKSASDEQHALIKSAQRFEEILGTKAHTTTDKGGTFAGGGGNDQLDCQDEMLNTAMLLYLLHQHQLLKYHQALGPAVRGHFIFGWPHTAMAIQNKTTQDIYILDTWEKPHAMPALLLPVNEWRNR